MVRVSPPSPRFGPPIRPQFYIFLLPHPIPFSHTKRPRNASVAAATRSSPSPTPSRPKKRIQRGRVLRQIRHELRRHNGRGRLEQVHDPPVLRGRREDRIQDSLLLRPRFGPLGPHGPQTGPVPSEGVRGRRAGGVHLRERDPGRGQRRDDRDRLPGHERRKGDLRQGSLDAPGGRSRVRSPDQDEERGPPLPPLVRVGPVRGTVGGALRHGRRERRRREEVQRNRLPRGERTGVLRRLPGGSRQRGSQDGVRQFLRTGVRRRGGLQSADGGAAPEGPAQTRGGTVGGTDGCRIPSCFGVWCRIEREQG
mmetsp:Transcript_39556/g.92425  ORF Transcript_39556/g.92425 Transcript_39556/m.92425 type:complete len:309 (-) Transcript_39556:1573-2499(-)